MQPDQLLCSPRQPLFGTFVVFSPIHTKIKEQNKTEQYSTQVRTYRRHSTCDSIHHARYNLREKRLRRRKIGTSRQAGRDSSLSKLRITKKTGKQGDEERKEDALIDGSNCLGVVNDYELI